MRKTTVILTITNIITLSLCAYLLQWMVFALRHGQYTRVEYEPRLEKYEVVAFGDSLVEGLGATDKYGFIDMLEAKSGVPILNLGKRRDRTDQLLSRIDQVLAEKPKLVIMTGGGNDLIRKYEFMETRKNLDEIFTKLEDANIRIIYLASPTGILSDIHASDLKYLTQIHGNIVYVPNIMDGILFNPKLLFDPVHPNDQGHYQIAEKVYPILIQELQQLGIMRYGKR